MSSDLLVKEHFFSPTISEIKEVRSESHISVLKPSFHVMREVFNSLTEKQ